MHTCNVCNKKFSRLRQHMFTSHPEIGLECVSKALLSVKKIREDAVSYDYNVQKKYIRCSLQTCTSIILEKGYVLYVYYQC